MAERHSTIKAVRQKRQRRLWEQQRRDALMREQVEHCYRVFTPAQIAAAKAKS